MERGGRGMLDGNLHLWRIHDNEWMWDEGEDEPDRSSLDVLYALDTVSLTAVVSSTGHSY